MTATYAPMFKLLRKDQSHDWTEDFQKAFDSIKEYLSEPLILSPPVEGRPLIMYLTVLDGSMGCVLGQQDESGKKEYAIYYLSKKFLIVCLGTQRLRRHVVLWLGMLSAYASIC